MEEHNKNLVSIIMLSYGNGRYVEESVRSVLTQTYQNWELLFVAEKHDDALTKVLNLKSEIADRVMKEAMNWSAYTSVNSRIKVSYIVGEENVTPRRNAALKEAKGRWITFLDVGDVWEPKKLERQIGFMEANGFAFSYTKYGLINESSEDCGVTISGKAHLTNKDMMKCCWPAYLTVMYDAEKIGIMEVRNQNDNNDYALWLNVSKKADCYLLDENLAKMRTHWDIMGHVFLTNKIKWRYDVYRSEEKLNPFVSCLMTMRNLWYGLVKWWKYVDRK